MRLKTFLVSIAILLLIILPISSYGWKFVSMADSRGGDNSVNMKVFLAIIDRVNAEKPDLVIFQGDAVSGSKDPKVLSSQMDTWLSAMKKLKCRWYYVPGNHEIRSAACEDVLREKIVQPLNGPPGHKELVFSFDYKNAHFVGLNSYHPGEAHRVQIKWLEEDLKSTTKPHIFVMAHDPAYPVGPHVKSSLDAYPKERDAFWKIMEKAGVRIYFCGHEHLYKRSRHGNIYQVINGTCGAPTYKGESAVSKYHYVVVEVDGPKVRCTAKDKEGKAFDEWEYSVD
ncbi:MAG: metallophosphoesterase [Armatimonadota bacterium]|nr:metallophosphoesterase [Armatimonadota bacterium]